MLNKAPLIILLLYLLLLFAPQTAESPLEAVMHQDQGESPQIPPKDVEIAPVLKRIAECESGDQHFDENGEVIISVTDDIGRYQINKFFHEAQAEMLGLDLYNEQDNETFALWLFDLGGTKYWLATESCWSVL